MLQPCSPVLYAHYNPLHPHIPDVVLLIYSNSHTEETLQQARETPLVSAGTGGEWPKQWYSIPTKYYVSWQSALDDDYDDDDRKDDTQPATTAAATAGANSTTTTTIATTLPSNKPRTYNPSAEQTLLSMLHQLVPHQQPFFFSCIPMAQVESVIHQYSAANHTIVHVNEARQWSVNLSAWDRHCEAVNHRPVSSVVEGMNMNASSSAATTATIATPSTAVEVPASVSSSSSSTSSAVPSSSSSSSAATTTISIGPLTTDHTRLIVDTWIWASTHADNLVNHLVSNFNTACIYHHQHQQQLTDTNGSTTAVDSNTTTTTTTTNSSPSPSPQCWILTTHYNCLGMLLTLPEARGKGYAKLCVQYCVEKEAEKKRQLLAVQQQLQKQHPHQQQSSQQQSSSQQQEQVIEPLPLPPHAPISFAYITKGNTASERVFTACGFTPDDKITWALSLPKRAT